MPNTGLWAEMQMMGWSLGFIPNVGWVFELSFNYIVTDKETLARERLGNIEGFISMWIIGVARL